ncbi:unnamed protein product [Closterium sp. NIES-65]|nr:unnamed protein product [Closterium sp. NIES-65]
MQVLRNALFIAYGNANFTRSAFLKHAKSFEDADDQTATAGVSTDARRLDEVRNAEAEVRHDGATGAEPAAADARGRRDMQGRVCVVTGGNQGIGRAAATAMAQRGATVHIVCRNEARGAAAASEIAAQTGNDQVFLQLCDLSSLSQVHSPRGLTILVWPFPPFYLKRAFPALPSRQLCDLSSLSQVRSLADRLAELNTPIHVLVNNAGVMEHEKKTSPDGFELNFAVNVLGTFVLTEALLPLLQRAASESKVITVATGGILTQPLSTDLQMEDTKFDGTDAYARNKRVQVALTEKWAELYGVQPGVGFYSMHPGWVDTAVLQTSMPGFYNTSKASLRRPDEFKTSLRRPEEGADTIAWLASQPESKLVNGGFYFDRRVASKHLPFAGTEYKKEVVDEIYTKLKELAKITKE